jgi:hypothetical protein
VRAYRSPAACHHPGGEGPSSTADGWLGCNPSRHNASAATSTVNHPRHRPSSPGPHARANRTSRATTKGIQSIPRSRSQARTAARGVGRPPAFSYDATVIQSGALVIRTMMREYDPAARAG